MIPEDKQSFHEIEVDIAKANPGDTIILSTTSPDKKRDYDELFAKYDINFFTLEDFGISPQKTPEKTNDYFGNLLEKGDMVGQAIWENRELINAHLIEQGVYTREQLESDKPSQLFGMVEDAGIEFHLNYRNEWQDIVSETALQAAYSEKFAALAKERMMTPFENAFSRNDEKGEDAFFDYTKDEEIYNRYERTLNHIEWMFDGESGTFPGANLKPVTEHLQGGFREMMDIAYQAAEEVFIEHDMMKASDVKRFVNDQRVLSFNNRNVSLLVPKADAENRRPFINARNIVEGENRGRLASKNELNAMYERLESGISDNPKDPINQIYLSDVTIPKGQKKQEGESLSRKALIEKGLLSGKVKGFKTKHEYRLDNVKKLAKQHDLPEGNTQRWVNNNAVPLAFLAGDVGNTSEIETMKELLNDQGITVLSTPDKDTLLNDPDTYLLQGADAAVLVLRKNNSLDDARALIAATTDKQTRPEDKEKMLLVFDMSEGTSLAVNVLQQASLKGLINGDSYLNDVMVVDGESLKTQTGVEQAANIMRERLDKFVLRQQRKIPVREETKAEQTNVKKNQKLKPLDDKEFTVFVGGGAANDYPGYKEAAYQIGKMLYQKDAVLTYGAGAKDGEMGAVHSGFVDAYLEKTMQDSVKREAAEKNVVRELAKGVKKSLLTKLNGDIDPTKIDSIDDLRNWIHRSHANVVQARAGDSAQQEEAKAIAESRLDYINHIYENTIQNPDTEMLVDKAPNILKEMLDPSHAHHEKVIGSLLKLGRMQGVSMEYLLTSEGTGEPPIGVVYEDAGNMQRRMEKMLQAKTHIYTAGGQGTIQELLESVDINIKRIQSEEPMADIIVLNQDSYDGGKVFDKTLELIDQALDENGLTRDNIRLREASNNQEVAEHFDQSKQRWIDIERNRQESETQQERRV